MDSLRASITAFLIALALFGWVAIAALMKSESKDLRGVWQIALRDYRWPLMTHYAFMILANGIGLVARFWPYG